MSVIVKPLEWNAMGFASSPVGLCFSLEACDDGVILSRVDGPMTTKSAHEDEAHAKEWAFKKYEEQVLSALT